MTRDSLRRTSDIVQVGFWGNLMFTRPQSGNIVPGVFTPVLGKHTKSFNLIDTLAIGVDRIQRSFEPMRRQVEIVATDTSQRRQGEVDPLQRRSWTESWRHLGACSRRSVTSDRKSTRLNSSHVEISYAV